MTHTHKHTHTHTHTHWCDTVMRDIYVMRHVMGSLRNILRYNIPQDEQEDIKLALETLEFR
jgi:hypothetical protein